MPGGEPVNKRSFLMERIVTCSVVILYATSRARGRSWVPATCSLCTAVAEG
jgi:hypothetical protein